MDKWDWLGCLVLFATSVIYYSEDNGAENSMKFCLKCEWKLRPYYTIGVGIFASVALFGYMFKIFEQ